VPEKAALAIEMLPFSCVQKTYLLRHNDRQVVERELTRRYYSPLLYMALKV
jgi:hypothetical protein